ncbi:MAG: hypothetical protein A2Y86_03830 [Candidatus Aminicenantes bacterium RBG_13_62_12]|nr:MAG: hypothetical protein A2Y86_03830 [Candidatus Aminicenantes bacterium RBG_13_62_12]
MKTSCETFPDAGRALMNAPPSGRAEKAIIKAKSYLLRLGMSRRVGGGSDMLAGRRSKMPEFLEERFGRAKSGLRLAPAKTQALLMSSCSFPNPSNPD